MKVIFLKYIANSILIILVILSVYVGFNRALNKTIGSRDFRWSTSKLLLEKQNPYQKFFEWKEDKIEKPYKLSQAPNYPASALIFLWPLASLNWERAILSWAILNVVFTFLIVLGLQKLYPINNKQNLFFVVVLFIIGSSWRTHLGNGQHTLFVLAFFIWAVIFSKKNKIIAGVFLAVSWFKYSITFPLSLFFLNKKNYKILIISGLIHVLLTVFVSGWINQSIFDFFLGPVKVALQTTGLGEVDFVGIIQKYSLPEFVAILLGALLFFLTYKILVNKKKVILELLLISFFALLSMVLFFHLAYDFVVLIFPLWYLFSVEKINREFKILTIVLVGLQWFIIPSIYLLSPIINSQLIINIELILNVVKTVIFYLLLFVIVRNSTNFMIIGFKFISRH